MLFNESKTTFSIKLYESTQVFPCAVSCYCVLVLCLLTHGICRLTSKTTILLPQQKATPRRTSYMIQICKITDFTSELSLDLPPIVCRVTFVLGLPLSY